MNTILSLRGLALAAAAALLAGCTSLSPDGGAATVSELTRARTGQPVAFQRSDAERDAAQARVAERLQQPLSAASAVEIARLNHRGLQARFAELGVVEADLVRGARGSGPRLSLGRLAGGGVTEIHRALSVELLSLLALPTASQAAR